MGDIEADFAEMDAGRPAPKRDEKGKFKPADKAPEAPPEKPVEKAPEKPAEEVKPPEKPADQPETKPVRAAELRTAYEGLKKKVKEEYEPQLQQLKSKVTELESRQPEDTTPLMQKLKAAEETTAQLQRQLALADYREEPAYKQAVQKFNDEWYQAVGEFEQLRVKIADGEDDLGNPKFTYRPANDKDLVTLANMPLAEMDEAATQMFGASSARVIARLESIRRLSAEKDNAEKTAQETAVNWKSEQVNRYKAMAQFQAKTWADVNKTLQEKFPKAFTAEEGDAEDKSSHTKGFALADLMFLGSAGLTPEQVDSLPGIFKDTVKAGKPLNEAQKVHLHAIARLKMANHDRKVAQLKKATARIAELEKTLAEYEKSEPTSERAGVSGGISNKPWDEQVADELRALDHG